MFATHDIENFHKSYAPVKSLVVLDDLFHGVCLRDDYVPTLRNVGTKGTTNLNK